jgi:hypothetical protein
VTSSISIRRAATARLPARPALLPARKHRPVATTRLRAKAWRTMAGAGGKGVPPMVGLNAAQSSVPALSTHRGSASAWNRSMRRGTTARTLATSAPGSQMATAMKSSTRRNVATMMKAVV